MSDKADIQKKIEELESLMGEADFWTNKDHAQTKVKELQELKLELLGAGKYDKGDAVISILSGAGGDDAEDFSRMLFEMYTKYISKKGWGYSVIHSNDNDHGGFRNITIEIQGKNAFGILKNEAGVHRLVRTSPFNSKGLRHTSFSLVEVVPKLDQHAEIELRPEDLKIEFARSSGPGGQNVNKRETAVRIVHLPTKLAVHSESQRSQAQNKEKALEILKAKVYVREEEERKKREAGLYVSKTTDIEWGNQIRSYVLHPYKMIKDHRTLYETAKVDKVLDGDIDEFLEAEKGL